MFAAAILLEDNRHALYSMQFQLNEASCFFIVLEGTPPEVGLWKWFVCVMGGGGGWQRGCMQSWQSCFFIVMEDMSTEVGGCKVV